MNDKDLKKHIDDLKRSEKAIRDRLEREQELSPVQKAIGVICLLGFVALLFLGSYAALVTGRPLIPYNPEVMNWELPWWMVD